MSRGFSKVFAFRGGGTLSTLTNVPLLLSQNNIPDLFMLTFDVSFAVQISYLEERDSLDHFNFTMFKRQHTPSRCNEMEEQTRNAFPSQQNKTPFVQMQGEPSSLALYSLRRRPFYGPPDNLSFPPSSSSFPTVTCNKTPTISEEKRRGKGIPLPPIVFFFAVWNVE